MTVYATGKQLSPTVCVPLGKMYGLQDIPYAARRTPHGPFYGHKHSSVPSSLPACLSIFNVVRKLFITVQDWLRVFAGISNHVE